MQSPRSRLLGYIVISSLLCATAFGRQMLVRIEGKVDHVNGPYLAGRVAVGDPFVITATIDMALPAVMYVKNWYIRISTLPVTFTAGSLSWTSPVYQAGTLDDYESGFNGLPHLGGFTLETTDYTMDSVNSYGAQLLVLLYSRNPHLAPNPATDWLTTIDPAVFDYSMTVQISGSDKLHPYPDYIYSLYGTPTAITVTPTGPEDPPTISVQPVDVTVTEGGPVTLSVAATGSGPVTYQWKKDGVDITGATNSSYYIPATKSTDGGSYTVVVSNSGGSVSSRTAHLTVSPPPAAGRLMNISIRTNAGTGERTLLVGFVLGGPGTSDGKELLIRAVGPTLTTYGVTDVLVDPKLEVIGPSPGVTYASNDNWGGDPQVSAVSAALGAFALPAAESKDAALTTTAMASGVYSLKITGAAGATGISLAEIYDATPVASYRTNRTPRLINVSARCQVGLGNDVLIAGFVVGGSTPCTVLVRAVGPRLQDYGVEGVLNDPQLDLYRSENGSSILVASNDNWGDSPSAATLPSLAASLGAFSLAAGSKDAAVVTTLPPGVYTAKISGVGGTTGVALVEVYEVH